MSFQLDPFQERAIAAIQKGESVFVSAPTGAGKTLIAESVIEKALAEGESVIYTAPVKALSNQKYRDFSERYPDKTGILTGDVAINTDAPILIMTTEIYRNSLLASHRRINNVGWIIFDEIHYLDDPERGGVWEEALLFTPSHIKILALSATVPNVREIADWIRTIHNREITVIEEDHRPVPLSYLYQCQGKIYNQANALRREGYGGRDDWRPSPRERRYAMTPMRAKPNRLDHLLEHVKRREHLPAIYFVFGRRRAETLASEAVGFDFLNPEERNKILDLFDSLLTRFDLKGETSAEKMRPIISRGIAYHHAGMLPSLKEVIERLFTSRLLKLIFTTETFALGINMPARSVLFDQLEKFYGTHFGLLTCRDFNQMAGRAGRRGLDLEGFAYLRIHPNDISFHELSRILTGKNEPIKSQFNASYGTLLNLYRDMGSKLVELYPRSFHYFQSGKKQREGNRELLVRKIEMLKEMGYLLPSSSSPSDHSSFPHAVRRESDPRLKPCGDDEWVVRGNDDNFITPKGEFAAAFFGYELILAELHGENVFEELNDIELCILLAGLIFEPRKGDHPIHLKGRAEKIRQAAEHAAHHIYRKEKKFRVWPHTRLPHFHLTPAVEAWARGSDFDQTLRFTTVDEGEFVRNLRMVIQILREMRGAPLASARLRSAAGSAHQKINRDVVDAERQLRA